MIGFPNIFGAYEARQLPLITVGQSQTPSQAAIAQVTADVQRWADYFDNVAQIYESALADRTQDATGSFGTGTAGGEMQPYTELGETEATRVEQSEWPWGLNIRRYRDRQMFTEEYLQMVTLERLAIDAVAATNRYLTTRIKMILRALFRNTSWTYVDRDFPGEAKGAQIVVFPLFNADGNTGRMYVNNAVIDTGAIQHYLFSGNGAITLANFTLGRTTLRDIGYLGRVVHIISPTDEDTVRGLAGFVPILPTAVYAQTTPGFAAVTTPVVTAPQAIGAFSNGGTSDGEVVVYPFWPAGYTMSMDSTKPKPLSIREHANPAFRGFRLIQDQTRTAYGDGDLRNKRFEYIAGCGSVNRANGVIVRAHVTAYDVPSI